MYDFVFQQKPRPPSTPPPLPPPLRETWGSAWENLPGRVALPGSYVEVRTLLGKPTKLKCP